MSWVDGHKVSSNDFLTRDTLKRHLTAKNTEMRNRPDYGLTIAAGAIWHGSEALKKMRNRLSLAFTISSLMVRSIC